jgi:hypothetical protein
VWRLAGVEGTVYMILIDAFIDILIAIAVTFYRGFRRLFKS